MNRTLNRILVSALLLTAFASASPAQEYVATPVVVSKEKVRSGGKIYYSHVVLERQTLYSISKAYGVTIQEIYDSNPTLNLETEGLKKNQILMIPFKEDLPAATDEASEPAQQESREEAVTVAPDQEAPAVAKEPQKSIQGKDDYFIHRVKWFEDLDAIAKKYNVSRESIININGMTSEKLKRRQELKIPYYPEAWEGGNVTPLNPEEEQEEGNIPEEEQADTTGKEGRDISDMFEDLVVREGNHDVNISMLIPFSAPRAGDRVSFMDFYCGSLLAARSLGNDGTNLDIHTYDVTGGNIPLTQDNFARTNFAIGPVSRADILKASAVNDGATWIVSPLDMQVESLADSISNLIQAPTPTSVQIKDMVDWIKSDMLPGDKVIVVTPANSHSTYGDILEREMVAAGLPHSTTTLGSMSALMTPTGSNRIVLSCDFNDRSTVFLIEAVRNLYMKTGRKSGIILYSTSKIRTYDQIEVEQLHKVNLHASVTYFVDYDSKDVKDFLLQYRALFRAEPSRSAYSGYDLMKYFSTLAAKYGKKWPRALDRVEYTGLQSDFKLERTESGSYVNKAVRRVVYNPDFSVSLIR
ncbi:MAG: LysM peptidoglycan-binding domain-containing protein [Bacteroidales bacterium]|nr:LysM peptidoglycan-binding domain-containing protein [Bacteroidales bacterium]